MRARTWIILLVVALLLWGGAVALRKWSSAEETRLAKLRPEVRAAWDRLVSDAAAEGIALFVISTARTDAEQSQKVAQGRSTTENSWHELRRAIDFNVGITDPATGKRTADAKATNVAHYRRVHELSKRHGFRGIPNGSPFKSDGSKAYLSNGAWDVYHLEYTEGMSWAQAAKRDAARDGVA